MKYLILFFLVIFFTSCQKDEDILICPNEVKIYAESFKLEGGQRGKTIFFDGLKIFLVDSLPGNQIGVYKHDNHEIFIDTSLIAYKDHPEALLFHELSHALLNRDHKNSILPDGVNIASIMHSHILPNYEWQGHQFKRQYYIDELFNPETPIPDWAN